MRVRVKTSIVSLAKVKTIGTARLAQGQIVFSDIEGQLRCGDVILREILPLERMAFVIPQSGGRTTSY